MHCNYGVNFIFRLDEPRGVTPDISSPANNIAGRNKIYFLFFLSKPFSNPQEHKDTKKPLKSVQLFRGSSDTYIRVVHMYCTMNYENWVA